MEESEAEEGGNLGANKKKMSQRDKKRDLMQPTHL